MTMIGIDRPKGVIDRNALTRGNAGAPGWIRTPNLLIRSLRPCVQRCPLSDREERSKPAQRLDQYA
jgi:hypothetical protein